MKQTLPPNLEKCRRDLPGYVAQTPGSIEGFFEIHYGNKRLRVMSGCGDGWDHVSVSLAHRTPTWAEMCFIKNLFWEKHELVFQFHPPEKDYIDLSKHALHLWRPWNLKSFELPPRWMLAP